MQICTCCNESYGILKAITTPGPETEEAAWNSVLPAVDQLQEFYDFSLELEACFPKLLVALCKNEPKDSLANQQALAKQLADVFDFVLRFDDAKVALFDYVSNSYIVTRWLILLFKTTSHTIVVLSIE